MESPTPGAAVFCAPARYTQGPGATQLLGQEMTVLGLEGPVLVIAGRSAEAALADSWRSSFHEAGMEHETLSFRGECSHAEIDRGIAHARKLGARTIVGSGGGKALDAAIGNVPNTPLSEGFKETYDALASLHAKGALDTRDLPSEAAGS